MSSGLVPTAQIERSSSVAPTVSEIAIQADYDAEEEEAHKNKHELIDFTSPFLFSDAVLMVEGKQLHCHRAILSLFSPVFKAMFQNRCLENQKNEVVIPLDEYDDIKEMLRHMYTPGGCDMTADLAERLLPILHRYQIDSLVDLAERTLLFRLNDLTAPLCLRMADLYGLERLRKAALETCARLDVTRLNKIFEEVSISAELRNEILERRIIFIERCLVDIQQSFTHSCSRMESRAERVPSNHCPLHSHPFGTITITPIATNVSTTSQAVGGTDQSDTNETDESSARTNVAACIIPGNVARNLEIRTAPGDNLYTDNTQTIGQVQTESNQEVQPSKAVCEQCVEQFKNHIQELCKRGLHKIPIITCRNL